MIMYIIIMDSLDGLVVRAPDLFSRAPVFNSSHRISGFFLSDMPALCGGFLIVINVKFKASERCATLSSPRTFCN